MEGTILSENKVTMNLGEFLEMRDALKFKEEIKEFALSSRKVYGNKTERDTYDIGNLVLAKLNIPLVAEDEEELFG